MNDETYEALKGIIGAYKAINWNMSKEGLKGLAMVEGWIDETAKEHPEECFICRQSPCVGHGSIQARKGHPKNYRDNVKIPYCYCN